MNKKIVHQLILDKLRVDLDIAERAAQIAYEPPTHAENIAENKYDTLGLEAPDRLAVLVFLQIDIIEFHGRISGTGGSIHAFRVAAEESVDAHSKEQDDRYRDIKLGVFLHSLPPLVSFQLS